MFYDRECSECGDMITTYTCRRKEGLCDECYVKEYDEEYQESLNFDFAYDHYKDELNTLEIPVVFTYVFKNSEMIETLYESAKKLAEEKMKEYLDEMARADNAREWLEDYRKWRAKNGT